MQHLSFQLLNLKEALHYIDQKRYITIYNNGIYGGPINNPVTKAEETDYSNPENILNRLKQKLDIQAQLNYGCAIGLAFSVNPSTIEEFKNDPNPDDFVYFISKNNNGITKFKISKNSYLLKGFNCQIPNMEFTKKNAIEDNISIFDILYNEYFSKAYNEINTKWNISSDVKNQLLTDLDLLMNAKPFLMKYNTQYVPDKYITNNWSFNINDIVEECLQPSNATIGYEASDFTYENKGIYEPIYGNFSVYVLLLSFGNEGVDDNCMISSINIGGTPLTYTNTRNYDLSKDNFTITITPQPKNRARVNYTINSVPNNANGISFKATY